MLKRVYKYAIYLTLVFLCFKLYKADYLEIPYIYDPSLLALSFLLLFVGFVMVVISEMKFLDRADFAISHEIAFAMIGLSIFGKYMPGKLWMIMGKSGYVAAEKPYPLKALSIAFCHVQVLILWCGIVLGGIGLLFLNGFSASYAVSLAVIVLSTVLLFSKRIQDGCEFLVESIFRRRVPLFFLPPSRVLGLLHWFFGRWVIWGLSFFCLVWGLSESQPPLSTIFCFPLAGTIGIIALFSPGGIGIREGAIVSYLVMAGYDLPRAVTISAASRLWFLIGECFMFVSGQIAHLRHEKMPNSESDGHKASQGCKEDGRNVHRGDQKRLLNGRRF